MDPQPIKRLEAVAREPGLTTGLLSGGAFEARCAFGRAGLTSEKSEGDGATPIGSWPLRKLYFRPDRLALPPTGLTTSELHPKSGWCDDPHDDKYNLFVELPYPASHERLWRDDHLYDLMIPLGYNDASIEAGRGSAIFFHLAKDSLLPTEGCVAIAQADMLRLLPFLSVETVMKIRFG